MALPDALWGTHPVSMRRLRHLVAGLPKDSAFFRSAYPEAANWTQTHELLATLIEVTDAVHLRHLSAITKRGTRLPKPLSITRPNVKPKQRRKATADDLKKIFGGAVRYVPKEVSDA